jgi:hypothetical protein
MQSICLIITVRGKAGDLGQGQGSCGQAARACIGHESMENLAPSVPPLVT